MTKNSSLYILDTNIIRYLEDKESPFHETSKQRLSMLSDKDKVYLSVLTIYEIEYGIALSNEKDRGAITALKNSVKQSFTTLPLTEKHAQIFGEIKALYKKKTGISKKAIQRHNIDFMLASLAISENAILVTNDDIFKDIQEIYTKLKIENWTE